jgi:hypothetical protein
VQRATDPHRPGFGLEDKLERLVVQCVSPGQEATAWPPEHVQTFETEEGAGAAAKELRQRLGIEAPVMWWFP